MMNLAELLKTLLASSYAYTVKAQYFHWNVEGPDFYQLHKFLQKIYEASYKTIDVIAEEIRTLNEYTPGSFERFQELSQIIGQTKVPRGQLMLEELLADSNVLIGLITQTYDAANAEDKQDIANYMAELLANYNKFKWQLQSFLKVARA
jgi:starvation-inducible DNA-binding protein